MQLRKVQEMGGATYLVSLPKEWARSASVTKGSVVSIENSGDGGLLIYPVSSSSEGNSEREVEITYPSRFSNEGLSNEIIAAYLLGYDLIRIRGNHHISSKDREKILFSIKRLIGLEIVEEDAQSIKSQFLVDKSVVEPSKIFRRISAIVRAMISDTIKQLTPEKSSQFEPIAQRDDEVDRLHFLLVRLIRSAVREPRSASKFGLSSIDCLDYRVAANSLETAGDYAVELSQVLSKLGNVDQRILSRLESTDEILESIIDSAVRGFIGRDFTLAQRAIDECQRMQDLITSFRESEGMTSLEVLRTLDILERIVRCHRDIADLISPMHPA
jgi:phosphate uptake regulator